MSRKDEWSDAICIKAQALRDAGQCYRDIAQRIGRPYESVKSKFQTDPRLVRSTGYGDEGEQDRRDARYVELCLAQGGFRALHEDRYAKGVCIVRPFYAEAA